MSNLTIEGDQPVRIVAYLEPPLAKRLREAARENERSVSGEIRLALKRRLDFQLDRQHA